MPPKPKVKLSDVLDSFDGSADIVEWLKKAKLACSLQGYGDPVTVLPLFLSGPAFTLYDQLTEDNKKSMDEVEKALINAFSLNKFAAYEQFRRRDWHRGETVDTFMAELRRLLSLSNIDCEELVIQAFIVGLPPDVSGRMRAYVETMERMGNKVSAQMILGQARVFMSQLIQDVGLVALENRSKPPPARNDGCFNCGKQGHFSRNCPMKNNSRWNSRGGNFRCYRCGKDGHTARFCQTELSAENKEGKSPLAPPISPQ